jgi:outer membrane protein assembly factor BamB
MRRSSLYICIVLFFAQTTFAEDWPEFRGPTGQGISASKNVPIEWSATNNVAWKTPIPGRAWSSPVVVGDRVYLTSATGESGKDLTLRAMCLEAASGKILWDTELFRPKAGESHVMHSKNSQASPTPVVAGERMYVHFGHLGTAALDLSGKVIWRNVLAHPAAHGNGGSPILVDDLLIFNCDGRSDPFIAALDIKTGKVRWKTPRNSPAKKQFSVATPSVIEVDGKTQVISPASGFVGAYDPSNGRELWRVAYGEGYSVVPKPAFANGVIVLSSGYDTPTTLAIDPQGAKGNATRTNLKWQARKAAPLTPSPLIVGDDLYLISDNGIATCSDLRSGKVHWTHRLDGDFSASPVFAEGRIYFQNETGVGYVVRASKEFELVAENDLGEPALASYAVTDGALYIRTDRHLWKIGR